MRAAEDRKSPGGALETEEQSTESNRPLTNNSFAILGLFVYGTLKRGYRNHDLFCQGLLDLREAQVRGRLYDGPGFPVLEVSAGDILAQGTSRPLDDVAAQASLSEQMRSCPRPVAAFATSGAWSTVHGELLSFDDPECRLPGIDRLEGFRPGERSVYRRVLVPVVVNGACEIAWVYTVEMTHIKQRRLFSGRWPE